MKELRIIIRGSAFRVVGLIANTLVGFILMPLLVHNLGDRMYGYWTLAGTILGYYGLLDFGIVSAVQFHVAKALGERDLDGANRAVSTAFFAFAALGSAALLITAVVAAFAHIFIAGSPDIHLIRRVIVIMGVGFAIGFPGRAFLGAISAHLRWDLIASVGLAVLVLRATAFLFVIRMGWGIVSLAAVTVLLDILVYSLYFFILKHIQISFRLSFAQAKFWALKEVLHYSVYSFVIKLSDQLRFYIDVVAVSAIIGVGAVTHYTIGSRLALSFRDLLIAILGILAPWFSVLLGNADVVKMRNVLRMGTKLSVSTAGVITCCLILYGKDFIRLWMGPAYLDAYWPLVVLALSVLFTGSQLPASSYLYGVSKHRFLAYLGLAEGAINVILSILLAQRYGLIGVALGTLIPVTAAWLVIVPFYVCSQVGVSLKTYYLTFYLRPMGVVVVSVVGPWLIIFRSMPCTTLVWIGTLVTCQVIIAIVVGYIFAFGNEDRDSFTRVLSGQSRSRAAVPTPSASEVGA